MKGLLSAVALGAVLCSASTEARDLRYSNYLPPHSVEGRALAEFAPALKDRTDGELNLRVFPGGQLLSAAGTLKGIKDGVVDMGFVVLPLTIGELKHANIGIDLQLHAEDPLVAMGAVNQTLMQDCEGCIADFDAQNAIYLGGHAAPPAHLMCTGEVNSVADLRGRKVRVTGSWSARLVNDFGMVPVQLAGTEIASALSGGQIDCVMSPVVWLEDLQLWDSIRTVVELPLGANAGLGLYVINKNTFANLSEDQKKILLDLVAEGNVRASEIYLEHDGEVRAKAKERGVKFVAPAEGLTELLDSFKKNDIKNVASDMSSRGVTDPEKIIATHLKNIEGWGELVTNVSGDRQKYIDALKELTMGNLYNR